MRVKFSENKRKFNLRKVKSLYFVSYDCYRKDGSFATCGNYYFESYKNNLCFGNVGKFKDRIIEEREEIIGMSVIIKNIQKLS